MHQAILPTLDCYRLKHHQVQRLKQPGPGSYDICAVCSMGYDMALQVFMGDEQKADEFVQDLRRER
jgi:hypothetical protein